MSAWSGWESDVLRAGGWSVTPENVRFLSTWHTYEQSACGNNPLNTTLQTSASTTCNSAGVQSYPSPAAGASATVLTLKGPFYPNIVAALDTGDPFTYPGSAAVAEEIRTWGTPNFAAWFLQQTTGSSTGSQPGATLPSSPEAKAASALSGWADLRNSVNRHLPTQLHRAQFVRRQTLRALAARRRLRR
jgi:hypothetical protein